MADDKPDYGGTTQDVVNEAFARHMKGAEPIVPNFGTFALDTDVYIDAKNADGEPFSAVIHAGLYCIDLESDNPGSYNAAARGETGLYLYGLRPTALRIEGEDGEPKEVDAADLELGEPKGKVSFTLQLVPITFSFRETPIAVDEMLLWAAANDLEKAGNSDRAREILARVYAKPEPAPSKQPRPRHEPVTKTGFAVANDKVSKTIFNQMAREKPITPADVHAEKIIHVKNGKAKSQTEVQLRNMHISEEELERASSFFEARERIWMDTLDSIATDNPTKTRIWGSDFLRYVGIKRPTRPAHAAASAEAAATVWKMLNTHIKTSVIGTSDKRRRGYKGYLTIDTYRPLISGTYSEIYYTVEEEDAKALEDKAKAAAKRAKAADATPEMKAEAERLAEEAKEAGTLAKAAKERRLEAIANGEETPNPGKTLADWFIDLTFAEGEEPIAKNALPLLQYADAANEIIRVPEGYLAVPGSTMDDKRIAAEVYRHAASKVAHPYTFDLETLMKAVGTPNDKEGRRKTKGRVEKVLADWQSQGFIESWEFTTTGARNIVDGFKIQGFIKDGRRVVEIGEIEGE